MCGFLGGILTRPVTDADTAAFRAAVRTIGHRGPDSESVSTVSGANAVLAFRRLAIIDLVAGEQPMASEAGHHLVFNGEIYNYRELRDELERDGERLRTHSDTEVLLRRLARDGAQGVAGTRGMFGFAFLDTARRRLLLGRDRLGVKQVYYVESPAGFFFASEPKALLALPWVHAELDEERLPAYFTFRCVPAPDTLFKGIRKLPPGVILTFDLDARTTRSAPYWQVPEPDANAHSDHASDLDAFEAGFLEAVKYRLVSDVPVGAFLSGGLDSSLVVAAMRRLGHANLQTFSATFPGSPDDEAEFARRVSRRFGTAHHEWAAEPGAFLAALPTWVTLNDDLVADASSLPLLQVSRLARGQGCIVLLSGEGADELFAGYGSYHKFVFLNAFGRVVPGRPLRRGIADLLGALGRVGEQDKPRIDEYFVRRGHYMGTAALFGTEWVRRLVEGGDTSVEAARADGDRLTDLALFDLRYRIPDDLLVRTDRATMGASIEARVPFLDHRLVELTLQLPQSARALPGMSKILLRRLALRWGVPRETIFHRKIGFQIPIGDWFRGPLRGMWDSILRDRLVPSLNYGLIGQLIQAHGERAGHYEELLWRVAALELWYRRWVSSAGAAGLEGVLQAA